MADIFSKAKRSQIMAKIQGKDSKPEKIVRSYLFSKGFRFRKNVKSLPGKPDVVLPKYRTVVFIHGCFWHGHYCKKSLTPKTNAEFWHDKISRNVSRDKRNILDLNNLGWNVELIWQCQLKNVKSKDETLMTLINNINKNLPIL
ncbi:MAG: DNA mismatch endonuclease Vsr [Sphingobacteriales bacterium]|nr:MAG: DNA mismatch endonuclease Vsr [Sphingobacteriales bacterium]